MQGVTGRNRTRISFLHEGGLRHRASARAHVEDPSTDACLLTSPGWVRQRLPRV